MLPLLRGRPQASGPVPFMEQEILLAEAWAELMLLRMQLGLEEVCIDNSAVVSSLKRSRADA